MDLAALVLAQTGCLLALAATAWAAGWAAWGRRSPERLAHPLTYWNTQVVSKPDGTTDAFSVAEVSVTFVADSSTTPGAPAVRNVVSAPFVVPCEFVATARQLLRTKKIKGLHENDFIMASKIDRMFDRSDGLPDRQ